jgi:hypothetical protein
MQSRMMANLATPRVAARLGLGHGRPARLSRPRSRLADNEIAEMKAHRENLKRRVPGKPPGLATARFVDWARPFPSCDRMRQLVPSLKGPCTDSRRSNGWDSCSKLGERFETRLKPERNKDKDSF